MGLHIFADDRFYDDRGTILMRFFDDFVMFVPYDMTNDKRSHYWTCCVIKLPFVSGFHLTDMDDDGIPTQSCLHIVATYKTMHEAMGVLRVLWANGGLVYE